MWIGQGRARGVEEGGGEERRDEGGGGSGKGPKDQTQNKRGYGKLFIGPKENEDLGSTHKLTHILSTLKP